MSDSYITIITTKEVSRPLELKYKVVDFLQSKEYVEGELSDCVLGMKHKGYKPGKNHILTIEYDKDLLCLNVCGSEFNYKKEKLIHPEYKLRD